MTVTKKKMISKEKECFLSICLLSGEVSNETAEMMKKDIGRKKFNNHIIKKLADERYITKKGKERKPVFRLTQEGLEYLKIKCPGKYNYDIFMENQSYIYKQDMRERSQQLSLVLYALYKEGISIENHIEDFTKILHGESVVVSQPFFISAREVRKMDIRFRGARGARIFGYIVTSMKIIAVYAPDKDHHLPKGLENQAYEPLRKLLDYAQKPYSDPNNYEILYLFNRYEDVVDSFVVGDRINTNSPLTKRVYENFRFKNSYIYLMFKNPYPLETLFKNDIITDINDTFVYYYELQKSRIKKLEYLPVNYLYKNKYSTAILWNMNPASILSIFEYVKHEVATGDYLLIVCFNEQRDLIERILNINKSVKSKIQIGNISCNQVLSFIKGETDYID